MGNRALSLGLIVTHLMYSLSSLMKIQLVGDQVAT